MNTRPTRRRLDPDPICEKKSSWWIKPSQVWKTWHDHKSKIINQKSLSKNHQLLSKNDVQTQTGKKKCVKSAAQNLLIAIAVALSESLAWLEPRWKLGPNNWICLKNLEKFGVAQIWVFFLVSTLKGFLPYVLKAAVKSSKVLHLAFGFFAAFFA